jgi:peroxiredoxin
VAEVSAQGHIQPEKGASLAAALDGPPTVECGSLIELPRAAVGLQQFWEVQEPGRPPRTWRVSGTEVIQGAQCVKLVGTQQSDDWELERGRADHTAWRRQDTVWLAPQQGIAQKVERVIERRDPARREPTYRSVLRYEREGQVTYPGKLFDDCVYEIEQARKFHQEAAPLLRQPALYRGQIEALLKRIDHHLQRPPTVGNYRKAVVQVRRRVQAVQNGEVTPEQGAAEPAPVINRVAPGQRVSDFVVTELVNGQSVRLYRLLGRPVLLVFYNPGTDIGRQVLRFGQTVSEKYRTGVTVLGLAVTDDEALVRRQCEELRLTFPILEGKSLHQTFGVDGTPRFVVLDGDGILRNGYTGWGEHTAHEVAQELQRWLPK